MDDIRPSRPPVRPSQPHSASEAQYMERPVRPALPEPYRPAIALPEIEPLPLLEKHTLRPPVFRRWWFWLAIGLMVVIILITAGLLAVGWYNQQLEPKSSVSTRIRVTIASGETASAIGDDLMQKGVIRDSFAFGLYARLSGKLSELKAGVYLFTPHQSVQEIINWLAEGKVDSFNVTILPGQTLTQIKASLISDGFKPADIDTAFRQTYTSPLLADKPADVNLEGYIFPDTYTITSETTVEQLLELSFSDFYARIQQAGLPNTLLAKGFNLHQAITLASIIEREASTASDQRKVAQVFEKRLQMGMALGSDVTYIYGASLLGVTPTPDLNSPYNTRINPGLPPGAISNFTMSALEAVANPAPTDYLYFVAGSDGRLYFAQTESEQEQNIANYCKTLCQ